jgi:hypothetical protein
MALRTVALCNGKYIGIETIYTVIDNKQINIPEKLKELREKSRNNELFCPCGCGSNLILVAGDKNLREQHFRLKDGAFNQDCKVIIEGKTSIDSKIVLKCWLDDKLKATDLESRVPIQDVDDINRKYEFTFLSREKKIALVYSHERVNIADEKIKLLESNSQGIRILYIVDIMNGGSNGQYPEGLMKIQDIQGYCLLLTVTEAVYETAVMKAVFYAKDIDGLWQEVSFAYGPLRDFSINDDGKVVFDGKTLDEIKDKKEKEFNRDLEAEKKRRMEKEKRRAEHMIKLQEQKEAELARQAEEAAKRKAALEEKQRLEEEQSQAKIKKRDEEFKRSIQSTITQQKTPVIDSEGNRWIKCEFCGKIAKDSEFAMYGGPGRVNIGTCYECIKNNPAAKPKPQEPTPKEKSILDPNTCPECGGQLRIRSGKRGKFIGCSNFPACRYTRDL